MPASKGPRITTRKSLGEGVTLVAQYSGGPYIEIGERLGHPVEVINVWDYEKGEARIPFTQEAVREALDTWVREYDEDDPARSAITLRETVVKHWRYY